MDLRGIFVFLLLLEASYASTPPERERRVTTSPSSITDCTHDTDCNNNECCVISPIRYSIPQCKKLLETNEFCRPIDTPLYNITLSYPDGKQIHVQKAHYILCPCAQGLTCYRHNEYCSGINENNNQLEDEGK